MPGANIFAYAMLLVWPFVVWQFYRRLDPSRALIWSILGGYLILPPIVAINLPAVPDFTKYTIPSLAALFCAYKLLGDRVRFDLGSPLARALMVVFIVAPFGTVLTNPEPLVFLQRTIPGLRLYDSVAAVANQVIGLLPFFLARRYLSDDDGMKRLVQALVVAGLVYSVPMLLEAAISPQLNIWVYGFFQHDFFQTIRAGGYRPVVFLPHGLWVAFFAMMAASAAAVSLRLQGPESRPKALAVLVYLGIMVLVCKSAGAILFTVISVPVLLFFNRRLVFVMAATMAALVMLYPILRGAHLVPLDGILELAAHYSDERAYSLNFRIQNEEALLAHAAEKPWFGWGGFNRSFLHDPVTGRDTVIADGAWIIILGINGWAGYIASFGLLGLPLVQLGLRALGGRALPEAPFAAAMALILGFNMVDMLPNATDIPFTWLMAGALFGYGERLAGRKDPGRPQTPPVRVVIG